MAKAKRYSMEQVQAAQKMLRGLVVKKSGKTKAEAVELLAGDVHKAVQQGHSLKDIQEMLGKAGIPVPLARLKALLTQKEDGLAHKSDTTPGEKDTAPPLKRNMRSRQAAPARRCRYERRAEITLDSFSASRRTASRIQLHRRNRVRP